MSNTLSWRVSIGIVQGRRADLIIWLLNINGSISKQYFYNIEQTVILCIAGFIVYVLSFKLWALWLILYFSNFELNELGFQLHSFHKALLFIFWASYFEIDDLSFTLCSDLDTFSFIDLINVCLELCVFSLMLWALKDVSLRLWILCILFWDLHF